MRVSATEVSLAQFSLHLCLQEFIYIAKFPPKPSHPQAKQPILPHGRDAQAPTHLCAPSLDSVQYVHVSPVLRAQN